MHQRRRDDRAPGAPPRSWWWMVTLFAAGSTCFLVAPLPVFLQAVGPQVDAVVFLLGSILFTAAASLQWLETARHGRTDGGGPMRSGSRIGSTGGAAPSSSSAPCSSTPRRSTRSPRPSARRPTTASCGGRTRSARCASWSPAPSPTRTCQEVSCTDLRERSVVSSPAATCSALSRSASPPWVPTCFAGTEAERERGGRERRDRRRCPVVPGGVAAAGAGSAPTTRGDATELKQPI